MTKHNNIVNGILTAIFAVFCLSWVYPIAMVVFNSFKVESAISTNTAFKLCRRAYLQGLPFRILVQSGHHGQLRRAHPHLLLDVRVVHHPCE